MRLNAFVKKPQAQNGARNLGKGGGLFRERVELRVQFVAQEKKVYPVSMLCRVMGVSRSGFYDYEKRVAQDPDPDHLDLVEMVRKISDSSDHTYGARRMSRALKALGYEVGRRRVRTLMRVAGIWVRYRKKYRVTTHSRHSHPVFS